MDFMQVLKVAAFLAVNFFSTSRTFASSADFSRYFENCLFREEKGQCCTFSPNFCTWTSVHRYSYCVLSVRKCRINSIPDVGFAHSLGMQSGRIQDSKLSSYGNVNTTELSRARLYGPVGWRPSDATLTALGSSALFSLNSASLQSVPVFFEVTFTRMQKFIFVIIQNNELNHLFSQNFALLHKRSSSFESIVTLFTCNFWSNAMYTGCRHLIVTPFRATVVRIVSPDYDTSKKPKWWIDFGGMDYLEADHHWRFDKIMMRPGQRNAEFPDERGNLTMVSTIIPYTATAAVRFMYTSEWEKWDNPTVITQISTAQKSCFWNPSQCAIGLTVSFWFKASNSEMLLDADGNTISGTGFNIKWHDNKTMDVKVTVTTGYWQCSYTVPECRTLQPCNANPIWHHFLFTWSSSGGLVFFVDGQGAATTPIRVLGSFTVPATNIIKTGLSIRDLRIWDYTVTSSDEVKEIYESAYIDYTITAFDDLGDWKLGTGCTETINTGPCKDYFFSTEPYERIDPLLYTGYFYDSGSYYNFNCFRYYNIFDAKAVVDREYGVAAVTGFSMKIDEHFNYEEIVSFNIYYPAERSNMKIDARIYIASSFDFDKNYQVKCRFINFRHDVYAGPVYWNTSQWSARAVHVTPNLVDILRPFLDRSTKTWRKSVFLVIEWLAAPDSKLTIQYDASKLPYFVMKYADKSPEKYLYADATLAPNAGFPQRYTTRPFVPLMKCLKFKYYMYGNGIGVLLVTIHQNTSLYKEVFRLNGDQGQAWQKARVPLNNLKTSSGLFQITFTAIRGDNATGDIAIDLVRVTVNKCNLLPKKAKPPKYTTAIRGDNATGDVAIDLIRVTINKCNLLPKKAKPPKYTTESLVTAAAELKLPLPKLLLPLDSGLYHLSNQSMTLNRAITPASYTTDAFGFPLVNTYFNGISVSAIEILTSEALQTNPDFSITFNVRPMSLSQGTILFVGTAATKELSVEIVQNGKIAISLPTVSGTSSFTSKIMLVNDTWSYLSFTYSSSSQVLKIYLNGVLMEDILVGFLNKLTTPTRILVGRSDLVPNNFIGHVTCVQLFNEVLESHLVNSMKLCLNKHVTHACKKSCKADGVCNQITGNCLCPPYASRYILDDCSSSLESSLYKSPSMHATFDSKNDLKTRVGYGEFYKSMDVARNQTGRSISKQVYFTTPGAVNLAVCTASDLAIKFVGPVKACVLDNSCLAGFSLSIWLSLPWKNEMVNKTSINLASIGILQVQFNSLGSDSNGSISSFIAINVTKGNELCQWRVNSSNELNGVWTHLVITTDGTSGNLSVFFNGLAAKASRTSCLPANNNQRETHLGGGAPYVCFDELVLWNHSLPQTDAKRLFDAIAFSGYEASPKKLNFSMLSFNDEDNSLWGIDMNKTVYYYSLSSYWIKVGHGITHVSSGRNGVWAVDTDMQLRFREGITHSNPIGTSWRLVVLPTNEKIQRIQSSFTTGKAFAISQTFKLFCLMVSDGNVKLMNFWNIHLKDIACNRGVCFGQKSDGKSYLIDNSYTNCNEPRMALQSYLTFEMTAGSSSNFYRIQNESIFSYVYLSPWWTNFASEEKMKFKYVIGINGKPVGITKSGELKMIGTGENTFEIYHTGGLCVKYKVFLSLRDDCTIFELDKNGCLKNLLRGTFVKSDLTESVTCENSFRRNDLYGITTKDMMLASSSYFPGVGSIIERHTTASTIGSQTFYFKQVSAFKKINSFYPRKKTQGTINGELKIEIIVMFRFRDFKFIDNFRDLEGLEATLVYNQVRQELDQTFTDGNNYVKSTFGEIRFKRQITADCNQQPNPNLCIHPLEVEFNGFVWLSSLSNYEKGILLSDKFKDQLSDCQEHICGFQLTNQTREDLSAISDIRVVKVTASSFVMRYVPRKNPGIHIGYSIAYTAERKLEPGTIFVRNFTLKDGLVFTITPLFAFATYNLTIKPLELQSDAVQPFMIQLDTSENAPSASPNVSMKVKTKRSCDISILDLPSLLEWNGKPLGYTVFYAKALNLSSELNTSFDNEKAYLFSTTKRTYGATSVKLENLEVFTAYTIYVGAYTAAGIGPVSRIFFRTKTGVPEEIPRNLNVSQVNSTYVAVTWQALNASMEVWNIWPDQWAGYVITIAEYSVPAIASKIVTVVRGRNQVQKVIGPLQQGREYRVRIGAINKNGLGQKTDRVCFFMEDGVPTAAPRNLTAMSNSSTSLNVTVGHIKLLEEKGVIVYYNLSATYRTASGKAISYHRVNITDLIINATNVNRLCQIIVRQPVMKRPFSLYKCPGKQRRMSRSSSIVSSLLSNLRYWTEYDVRASGCTVTGCGPFSSPVSVRTKEHMPTCSPTEFTTGSRTSTSLQFKWIKPLSNCTHGILTRYKIYFGPQEVFSSNQSFNDWVQFTKEVTRNSYFKEINGENSTFGGLKKFSEYCCAVAAATSNGFGPISRHYCTSTLEDRPDGPPTNVNGITLKDGVKISMQPPVKEEANGIIRGYIIHYSEKVPRESESPTAESQVRVTAATIGNVTTKIIVGLKPFIWYKFEAVAFTSVGPGARKNQSIDVLSQEAAPSASPGNISTYNVTRSGAELAWYQLPAIHMNGIFQRFQLTINETFADGSQGILNTVFVSPNATYFNSTSVRPDTANTNVSNTSSADSHASSVNTSSADSHASSVFNISSAYTDNIIYTQNLTTGMFMVSLAGLSPFTTYTVGLAACTNAGCGIKNHIIFRSAQYVPSSRPVITLSSGPTSVGITWRRMPILERNGVLTNFSLKWIKQCHLVRRNYPLNITAECNRVIPENSTGFSHKTVTAILYHATISNLTPYTFYTVRVAAETSVGRGPEEEAVIRTKEGVPSASPNITKNYNTSGRSIKLEWDNLALPYHNGILLGYTIFFQSTEQQGNNGGLEQHVNCAEGRSGVTKYELTGLDLYADYNISIAGFTSKGVGARTSYIISRTGPYAHGRWSDWSRWNYCTKNCDGGTQKRTRTCTNPAPWNGGDNCKGPKEGSQACNTNRCSGIFAAAAGDDCHSFCRGIGFLCMPTIDLKDSYSKFEELGLSCIDSSSERKWKQSYHPSYAVNTGLCAGYLNINFTVPCNATPPNDGFTRRICNCFDRADVGFTEWAQWGMCSKSCGGGVKRSQRECSIFGACLGNTTQLQDCNTTPCPVDGAWGSWSSYSSCNKSCGYGYQHRYRKCDNPPRSHGGQYCPGPSVDVVGECNTQICPVNGGWSDWESDGICNQPCGGGQFIKRRYCDNPKPLYNGEYCKGQSTTATPCNEHKCKGVEVLFSFRLLDYVWDFVYYSMSNPATRRVAQTCQENLKAVYSDSSFVTAVIVKNLRNQLPSQTRSNRKRRANEQEYVVANIEVYYSAVKQAEVLYLQDYVTATGKLHNLTITSTEVQTVKVLSGPPENVTAKGLDPNTIQLSWNSPVNISFTKNVTNYYIFYRKKSSTVGRWQIRGVTLANNVFNITRLDPVTSYRIRMTVSVEFGNGPASKEVFGETPEGAPDLAPANVTLQSTQPSEIYVEWVPLPYKNFNGLPLGYIIQYKLYKDSSFSIAKAVFGSSAITLKNLKAYSLYMVKINAYTATGNGPPSSAVGKTLEGVPVIAPPGVTVTQMIATNKLIVRWSAISEDKTNGRFKGYKVKYFAVKVSNKAIVGFALAKEIIVDKYTYVVNINGLQSYTTYAVSVVGYTEAGDGPLSTPINADTCRCPDNIFLNWHESRPYVVINKHGKISGIFQEIVDAMILKSCKTCNGKAPTINWMRSLTGESPQKTSEIKVKESIGPKYHVSFPIFGRSEITKYAEKHVFISLVNSPGSAMIVRNQVDYVAKTLNTFKSMATVWPMLVIIILFSFIFGILLWFVEQFLNEEFSRGRFFLGSCQGFWWAYVSMTTVGYGDVTPRSFLGRTIAICWTLIGLILMGIITGALTSSITTKTLPPDFKLYGSTAAVINNSFEYKLAVRRNSKVFVDSNTENAHGVLTALKQRKTDVALLDAFVSAAQESKLIDMELKVKQLIAGNSGYGFVLSNELVRLEDDFRSHIVSKQQFVSSFVANMTSKLQVSTKKLPEVMLFDPSTPAFWLILKAELFLLGTMCALGTLWTLYRYLRGRGNKVTSNSISDVIVNFVDSFEDRLEKFDTKVNKRAKELELHHEEEIQELFRLKKNFVRHEKRQRIQGLQLDTQNRTATNMGFTQGHHSKRNIKKYSLNQDSRRHDTDC